jgi:glycosyltransferase 2 family protein
MGKVLASGSRPPESSTVSSNGTGTAGFGIALKWRVLICCALLAALISRMDHGQLWETFRSASSPVLMVLLATHILYHTTCGYRWYGLLRCVDSTITFPRVLRISFISIFVGAMMPGSSGAEISRVVGVSRSNVTVTKAILSIALDRMLGTVTLTLMVLSGVVLGAAHLNNGILAAAALILAGVIVLAVLAMSGGARDAVVRMLPRRAASLIGKRIRQIAECIDAYRQQPWAAGKALLLSFVAQTIRVTNVWLAGRALGLQIPFAYLMVTVPLVIFLLMLPISIGGLGVREAGYIYFLGAVGIGSESAFAISVIIYLALMLSTLPGGLLLLLGRGGEAEASTPGRAAVILATPDSPGGIINIEPRTRS